MKLAINSQSKSMVWK